jgi:hypothetical protein
MGRRGRGWDDNARGATRLGLAVRDPRTGAFGFDRAGAVARHPASLPKPHPAAARRSRGRADPVGRRTAVTAQSAPPAPARASSASPAPTASPPPRRCCAHPGSSRRAAISAPGPLPPALSRRMASTCWKCRPTCWSASRTALRCAVMLNLARTIWTGMATWRAMRGESAHIFDRQHRAISRHRHRRPESRALAGYGRVTRAPFRARRSGGSGARGLLRDPAPAGHAGGAGPARRAQRPECRGRRGDGRSLGLSRDGIAPGCAAIPACRTGSSASHHRRRPFVNDSKATNADAAERALAATTGRLDRRRHGQGGRHRAAGVPVPAHRPRAADRPRRAGAGRDPVPRTACPTTSSARWSCRRLRALQSRHRSAPWCCSRPPAPASTSSPASSSAATASPSWPVA